MINVVQAHSASGTRYTVNVTCVIIVRMNVRTDNVFNAAENDATLGTAVTKYAVKPRPHRRL